MAFRAFSKYETIKKIHPSNKLITMTWTKRKCKRMGGAEGDSLSSTFQSIIPLNHYPPSHFDGSFPYSACSKQLKSTGFSPRVGPFWNNYVGLCFQEILDSKVSYGHLKKAPASVPRITVLFLSSRLFVKILCRLLHCNQFPLFSPPFPSLSTLQPLVQQPRLCCCANHRARLCAPKDQLPPCSGMLLCKDS